MLDFVGFFRVLFALFTALFSTTGAFFPAMGMAFTTEPAVFDCGNEYYSIVWATSQKGSGYIKYMYDGEEKIVWDADNGIIRSDDTVHSVLVPKKELQGNVYVAGSQYVGYKYAYSAIKGNTVETTPIKFRGVPKDDDIKILCITDIHEMENEMYKAVSNITGEPDMLVLLGDMVSSLETKSQFTDNILADAGGLSKGEIPIIYTRGNHETRGEYAAQMSRYFHIETGSYYFTTDFGALSAIVLDSGEDKDDSHEDYSGLVDFTTYRNNEFNWLNSLKADEFNGKYKIAFCHNPGIYNHFGQNWMTPLKELGFGLLVGGHYHTCELIESEIPAFVAGGEIDSGWTASMLTLKDGNIHMYSVDENNQVILDKTIAA